MLNNKKGKQIKAYIYLLPAAILLIIFLYYPVVESIGYSFFNFKNFKPFEFVGLDNYRSAFADGLFWNSIYLTFKWVIMNTIFPTFIGLMLSILVDYLSKIQWFTSMSRTILFMPMMMSMVAVGLLWTLIYNPNLGLLNGLLGVFGLDEKFIALGSTKTAIYMSFIPLIWQSSGFSMVVCSAALQSVSKEMLEASLIDGCNKFNQLKRIMLPNIVGAIVMVSTVNMISGFKAFDLLYVLTKGGPGAATEITAVYAYKQAFLAFKFDYASTMMTCLLICVIVFLLIFNFFSNKVEKKFGS
ncbi:MAG TPA: sugar ABC transporter permease [Ruminiclostridium sp.]